VRGQIFLIAAFLLSVGMPNGKSAVAHAYLVQASPAVGAQLETAPGRVRIEFSERIEDAFSWIHVLDAAGKRIDHDDTRIDSPEGSALAVTLGALQPGVYRVFWHVVSLDTHVIEGDFKFEIGAPAQ
jgi:methionine-rich copper-binding protein CopC